MLNPLDVLLGPGTTPMASPPDPATAVAQANDRIGRLEARLERLTTCHLALLELVRNRLGLTEAELAAAVEEVARQQAREAQATTCEQCRRPYDQRHDRCRYCGHQRKRTAMERLLRG